MNNPETLARLGKQNTGKTKKKHRKLKRQVTTDLTKQQGWTQVLVKGKQFLPLIRHLSCYSYTCSLHISVMHSVLKDLVFLYRSSSKKVKTFVENIYELLRSTERESVIGADFNIDLIKTTWQHLILSYVTISVSRTILTDIKTNNIYIELWSTWFSQKKKKSSFGSYFLDLHVVYVLFQETSKYKNVLHLHTTHINTNTGSPLQNYLTTCIC